MKYFFFFKKRLEQVDEVPFLKNNSHKFTLKEGHIA